MSWFRSVHYIWWVCTTWYAKLSLFFLSCRPLSQSFEFDHHYPKSENNSVAVVLYGKIGSQSFWSFHQQLEQLAENGNIHYILRHYLQVDNLIDRFEFTIHIYRFPIFIISFLIFHFSILKSHFVICQFSFLFFIFTALFPFFISQLSFLSSLFTFCIPLFIFHFSVFSFHILLSTFHWSTLICNFTFYFPLSHFTLILLFGILHNYKSDLVVLYHVYKLQ